MIHTARGQTNSKIRLVCKRSGNKKGGSRSREAQSSFAFAGRSLVSPVIGSALLFLLVVFVLKVMSELFHVQPIVSKLSLGPHDHCSSLLLQIGPNSWRVLNTGRCQRRPEHGRCRIGRARDHFHCSKWRHSTQ